MLSAPGEARWRVCATTATLTHPTAASPAMKSFLQVGWLSFPLFLQPALLSNPPSRRMNSTIPEICRNLLTRGKNKKWPAVKT